MQNPVYTIDNVKTSHLPYNSLTKPIKLEHNDSDGFTIKLSNPASQHFFFEPSVALQKIPLRATLVSKEIRELMGVFHLDPFATHNTSGQAVTMLCQHGNSTGPLEEEPQQFEFQLNSDDELMSISPEFEISNSDAENASQDRWSERLARDIPQWPWRPSGCDHPKVQIYSSLTGTSASFELEPYLLTDQWATGKYPPLTIFYFYSNLYYFFCCKVYLTVIHLNQQHCHCLM